MTDSAFIFDDGVGSLRVMGEISDGTEFINGKAYIRVSDGSVFKYSSVPINRDEYGKNVPVFWVDSDGYQFIEERVTEGGNKKYHVDNISYCDMNRVEQDTPIGSNFYNEVEMNDMNSSSEVYIPKIGPNDDYLKRLVKQVILDKKVDINSYKSRMDKKYRLTNMKSALTGTTKMTVPVFLLWADLLNFKFTIDVSDAGPTPLPIGGTLHYDSTTNAITKEGGWDTDDED